MTLSVNKITQNNTTPTVSVVVPNYNYAPYLDSRIKSILYQSFQDFELILLDDASTDDSVTVLEKYRNDPHVSQIIINEKNTGSPFQQWMKGILSARGKYVWIAEADDLSEPDFLEKCVKNLTENPDAVACVTGSINIDDLGNAMPRKANYWERRGMTEYSKPQSRFFEGRFYAIHKLFWACCIQNTSATVFSRETALKLANSPFLLMRYSGDWLFWAQMAEMGGIVEIYQNLNYFRQHNKKATEKGKKSGKSIGEDIEVIKKMEEMFPEIGKYQRKLCYGMLWRKIKKAPISDADKYRQQLHDTFGSTEKDHCILTFNRYLRYINPFLLTMERDRKKLPKNK